MGVQKVMSQRSTDSCTRCTRANTFPIEQDHAKTQLFTMCNKALEVVQFVDRYITFFFVVLQ